MRAGFTVSVIAHAVLLFFALIGLQLSQPLEPEQVESIAVDIIPLSEFANIRAGSLTSEVIETQAPSIVDSPEPAQLAERTGNTQEDQATPQEADTPTPAPTEQTAPTPAPEPEPQPLPDVTPQPEPQPVPEPQPEPQPAPQPEPAPTPEPTPEPQPEPQPVEEQPQPVTPAARPTNIAQKRQQFAQQQEQARQQQAQQQSAVVNTEETRGGVTGEGGQQSLGSNTGQSATLTRAEEDALAAQMRSCWRLLPGEIESGIEVRLLVNLNQDGSVAGTPSIAEAPNSSMGGSIARAAQRAVMQCGPYRLPAAKYAEWKQVDVTFRASDLR
ncbi:MAG: hypothetical protein H6873_12805 [Hyphomicrobiaceae bacterium]|nr:hypothetical protein [Hyphomicrobiaceae bacterium]